MPGSYTPPRNTPYRSSDKLRKDNALSEITSDATLKALALSNLGLSDVAGDNLAIASGKTLAVSNSLTLAGTDATTMTFPATSATLARTDAANTFTGVQTMTSPVLTTPSIGAASGTTLALSGSTTYSTASAGDIHKQGANGRVGTWVCNGATPVTISNTSVAITDAIVISLNTVGGTVGVQPHVVTITGGTGFTAVGTASDTSTYNYALIKNAA